MQSAEREVKLSCRHLWKIYGYESGGVNTGGLDLTAGVTAEERRALCDRLRQGGRPPAVIDATFDIHLGEIFVVMGLSGSGKSTLLRCLSRLIEPSAGDVLLDGEHLLQAPPQRLIELRRKAMGMVFQNFGLLPHLSVLDNVAFPLRIQGQPLDQRLSRAREMVTLVGLEGREGALPHQLSGGQQQRVGIARSLAVGPALWFLDEPFSALDPLTRRQMQDEFLRLQRLLNKTIVFVTHDIAEAFRLADRIAIMRDGEIIQIGRPAEIALHPADSYVAAFTEDISLTRFVTAGDLAVATAAVSEPGEDTAGPPEVITSETSLEALVPRLAAGIRSFKVRDPDGRAIGKLASEAALAILARDAARRQARS